jgi:hypothetical protein
VTHDDLAAHARAIIDANLYLTLGTADPDGRPWTSLVYFAPRRATGSSPGSPPPTPDTPATSPSARR